MEKHKGIKVQLLYIAVVLAVFVIIFAIGFKSSCSYFDRKADDSSGIEQYEKRSSDASDSLGRIEGGLSVVAEQMRSAGNEVAESLTGLGELREVSNRITERSQDFESTVGRIEDGICRIEKIIFKTEKENIVLADGYDCIDTGGSN